MDTGVLTANKASGCNLSPLMLSLDKYAAAFFFLLWIALFTAWLFVFYM